MEQKIKTLDDKILRSAISEEEKMKVKMGQHELAHESTTLPT